MTILDDAQARADARHARTVPTDYAALNRMVKRQKGELTRAVRKGDANLLAAVIKRHVAQWDAPGCMWPDAWSTWQRALDDALPWNRSVDIRDL